MPKSRLFPHVGINNQVVNTGILELYFLDLIFDRFEGNWFDGFTEISLVEEVISQVKAANPSTIRLIIDSEGGDAGIGLAVYNFLKHYDAVIEVEIIGMAGSIASVIAMAASPGKLQIARNGFMVIHQAWGGGVGNAKDLRQAADVIDGYTATIVDIYVQRTGRTAEEINGYIANGDFWMTGSQAVELGFADETLQENGQFMIAARIKDLNPNYRNVPQNLIEKPTEEPIENPAPEETSTPKSSNNPIMNFKQRATNFIANLKKGKINNGAANLAEEVANVISEPMEQMLHGLQEEFQADIDKITTDVTNSVTQAFETRIKALEDVNAALKTKNEELEQSLADIAGSEAKPKTDPKNEVKPVGGFR